jgi:predicted acylesterase/phospholipase RssA
MSSKGRGTNGAPRALCLPGSGCRGAFQIGVVSALWAAGERFDLVAGASSGSISGAVLVAGLAADGPDMFRSLAKTPIVSRRYLRTDGSPFGMGSIVRTALTRFVPEERIAQSEVELLVSTTRASHFLRSALESARARLGQRKVAGAPEPTPEQPYYSLPSPVHELGLASAARVIHSNRERQDMHDVIVASCSIPGLYGKLPVLDGEVHIDGGATDNTLLGELIARGAHDITIVTPFEGGCVSPTLFERERIPRAPGDVRLRILSPQGTIRLRHFDFDRARIEEALTMPTIETILCAGPS